MDLPVGFEDLRTEHEVENALVELREQRPGSARAVVKLNDSFSGEGNALFRYPEQASGRRSREALARARVRRAHRDPRCSTSRSSRSMGGIVEEFIEAREKRSPSAQIRVSPRGEVMPISTHDQILGGPTGQVFLGCQLPGRTTTTGCRSRTRRCTIGRVLASHGVVSRFGVDFLVWRDEPAAPMEPDRARDQPADGRHDPPVSSRSSS